MLLPGSRYHFSTKNSIQDVHWKKLGASGINEHVYIFVYKKASYSLFENLVLLRLEMAIIFTNRFREVGYYMILNLHKIWNRMRGHMPIFLESIFKVYRTIAKCLFFPVAKAEVTQMVNMCDFCHSRVPARNVR